MQGPVFGDVRFPEDHNAGMTEETVVLHRAKGSGVIRFIVPQVFRSDLLRAPSQDAVIADIYVPNPGVGGILIGVITPDAGVFDLDAGCFHDPLSQNFHRGKEGADEPGIPLCRSVPLKPCSIR